MEQGLASTREQRKNAGNKMSKLLADELDEDEFYKTALGGFEEESGDEEYASEDEESDQVDSDFSISETDEVVDQDEDVEGKKKRKKTLYREPKRSKVTDKGTVSKQREKPRVVKTKAAKSSLSSLERRKSTRALTVESSEMHRKRMEGKRKAGKKQVKFSQIRRLTQEELLAEAKITEELNIESLKAYQQMEESKKKTKNIKAARTEAMVRFLSVSMPLIEADEEREINVEDDVSENESGLHKDQGGNSDHVGAKCSRNFIIFTDPKTFPGSYFPSKNIAMPQKAYCPVTGLPAKYKDPLTGLPYATGQAFRYIREHYSKQGPDPMDKHGERKQ